MTEDCEEPFNPSGRTFVVIGSQEDTNLIQASLMSPGIVATMTIRDTCLDSARIVMGEIGGVPYLTIP